MLCQRLILIESLIEPYRNIEKELGINLLTLVILLKKYFSDENLYIYDAISKDTQKIKGLNLQNKYFSYGGSKYYFRDYGITWALTKEELENDK